MYLDLMLLGVNIIMDHVNSEVRPCFDKFLILNITSCENRVFMRDKIRKAKITITEIQDDFVSYYVLV